jgi:thiamine-phosphate pyrophosphorylase
LVGVSCYNDIRRARQAVAQGADYIAFGSFYPSSTKPDAVRAAPELLRRAKREFATPVVAIGGIDESNAAALVDAGADSVAVISAVFGAADVEAAARRVSALFERSHHQEAIG